MTRSLFGGLLSGLAALFAAMWIALGYAGARERVFLIAVAAGILAILIAYLVSRSVNARVRRLRALAETLPGGSAKDRPPDSGDELEALERSLGGVAAELQHLLENARYESARREAILSGMSEGVLAVDRDLRVIFCNRSFLRAIDFSGNNYEGRFVLELVRDPRLHELLRNVLACDEPRKLRFSLSMANSRTFEAQATPLEMPSGRGAIVILRDITDLERLEQVRKDFVANVSHELRTPLAGIIGYADTLLDGALEDERNRRAFVETIRNSAERLNRIAADLLSLSELESAADSAAPERIPVRDALDSAIATLETEARSREVSILRDGIEAAHVHGNRLRLEQALVNLVANAIKFNRPGGEVRVSAKREGESVFIRIADTGAGIPSSDLPRIFERFYRVDKARSRQVGGTGLGLSIVRHVVERMNGQVKVESQLGRGSVFTVILPAA